MRQSLTVASLFALLAACGGGKPEPKKPELTQRQKDSVLGQSQIPGARGVQKALAASDSLAKRQARIDSVGKDTL